LLVVNANPDDETTKLLSKQRGFRIRELLGNKALYWSGLQNIGLRHASLMGTPDDLVLMLNADITFEADIIGQMALAANRFSGAQVGGLAYSRYRVISSGVQVKSWLLGWNKHPLSGRFLNDVPAGLEIPVDYLPGRCVSFPIRAVRAAGLIAEHVLPHYAADYEYTKRIGQYCRRSILLTDIRVQLDVNNTGNDIYNKEFSFFQRLRHVFDRRTPYNPIDRINFVRLAYPAYAVPTAAAAYILKTIFEIALGRRLGRFLKNAECGSSSFLQ
jgi:GT2 family glycosyltransferase